MAKAFSIYGFLSALTSSQFVRVAGNLQTTLPAQEERVKQEDGSIIAGDRQILENAERGAFHRSVNVCLDPEAAKASLYICQRDNKTRDLSNDKAFDYTNVVVARLGANGRFEKVNAIFQARLSRAQYEELLAVGAVPKNADLSQLVTVDLRHLPVFPEFQPNGEYIADKLNLLALYAEKKKLDSLKQAARKFFFDKGITFDGLEPKQVRGVSNNVTVLVPYSRYEVVLTGDNVQAAVDDSKYRIAKGIYSAAAWAANPIAPQVDVYPGVTNVEGERQLTAFVYTEAGYNALKARLETVKQGIEALAESVRVRELGWQEHHPEVDGGTVIAGDGSSHAVKKVIARADERTSVPPSEVDAYLRKNPEATLAGDRPLPAQPAQVPVAQEAVAQA